MIKLCNKGLNNSFFLTKVNLDFSLKKLIDMDKVKIPIARNKPEIMIATTPYSSAKINKNMLPNRLIKNVPINCWKISPLEIFIFEKTFSNKLKNIIPVWIKKNINAKLISSVPYLLEYQNKVINSLPTQKDKTKDIIDTKMHLFKKLLINFLSYMFSWTEISVMKTVPKALVTIDQ